MYVVVVVLLMTGLHVPVMPLFEVVGNVNVPPLHIAATCVNVGVTAALIVIDVFPDPAALQGPAATEYVTV